MQLRDRSLAGGSKPESSRRITTMLAGPDRHVRTSGGEAESAGHQARLRVRTVHVDQLECPDDRILTAIQTAFNTTTPPAPPCAVPNNGKSVAQAAPVCVYTPPFKVSPQGRRATAVALRKVAVYEVSSAKSTRDNAHRSILATFDSRGVRQDCVFRLRSIIGTTRKEGPRNLPY